METVKYKQSQVKLNFTLHTWQNVPCCCEEEGTFFQTADEQCWLVDILCLVKSPTFIFIILQVRENVCTQHVHTFMHSKYYKSLHSYYTEIPLIPAHRISSTNALTEGKPHQFKSWLAIPRLAGLAAILKRWQLLAALDIALWSWTGERREAVIFIDWRQK